MDDENGVPETDDEYIQRMRQQSQWGGHLEIVAFSEILNRYIVVHRDNGETNIFHPLNSKPTNEEPLRLLYIGNNHYQAIVKKKTATCTAAATNGYDKMTTDHSAAAEIAGK